MPTLLLEKRIIFSADDYDRINRRLAARVHQQQIATLGVAEKLALQIDAAIEQVVRDILRGLAPDNGGAANFAPLQRLAGPLWPEVSRVLAERLPQVAQWSYKANAGLLLDVVPQRMWGMASPEVADELFHRGLGGPPIIPPRRPIGGAGGEDPTGPRLRTDIEHEPVLRAIDAGERMSDAAFEKLMRKVIFPPLDREKVDEFVYAET